MARPTKYTEEFQSTMEEIITDEMGEGASLEEVAVKLGIDYATINRWMKDPEKAAFCEAIKRGEDLSKAWWMEQGRTNLKNSSFNFTGWYMNMKNRHDWKDKRETTGKHTHKFEDMTDDQLKARIAAMQEEEG